MNNWPRDLKAGALWAVVFIILFRVGNIVIWGDFDFPTGGFLAFWFLWCWALGTYITRQDRIRQEQQEIQDLMTALRISLTGK